MGKYPASPPLSLLGHPPSPPSCCSVYSVYHHHHLFYRTVYPTLAPPSPTTQSTTSCVTYSSTRLSLYLSCLACARALSLVFFAALLHGLQYSLFLHPLWNTFSSHFCCGGSSKIKMKGKGTRMNALRLTLRTLLIAGTVDTCLRYRLRYLKEKGFLLLTCTATFGNI